MKKKDVLIIVALIAISLLAIGLFYLSNQTQAPLYARVTQRGDLLGLYPINENLTEVFQTDLGYNRLIIEDETVRIEAADCRDQICVKNFPISKAGETIVCLPHKLVIEIVTK